MTQNKSEFQEEENKEFNFLDEVNKYARFWYVFLISVFIFLFIAYNYLKHTLPTYQTNSEIKIIDNSQNGFKLPNSGFSLFARPKVNLDNEIEVIKSFRIMEVVARSLNLDTQYFSLGYFNDIELWKKRPFTIKWQIPQKDIDLKFIYFSIEVVKGGYRIIEIKDKQGRKTIPSSIQVIPFNSVCKVFGTPFKVIPQVNFNNEELVGKRFAFQHRPINSTVINLTREIKIKAVTDEAEVLQLSFTGINVDKLESVMNELIRQFDLDGVNDRRLVSQRTIDFVNDRFKLLEKELDSIETNKAAYKRNNELSFLEADALVASDRKVVAKNDVFQTETQIALSELLEKTIKSDSKLGLLPANIGVTNADVNQLVTDYNAAVLERDRIQVSAGDNNPKLKFYNDKLKELQKNIFESVKTYQRELEVSLNKNNNLKSSTINKFSELPLNEKVLRSIERQQNIKEALYLLLLQKREEAAINLAITAPSIKVVDYAITDSIPIAPKKQIIYTTFALIGFLLPFSFLYFRSSLDNKVHTKQDLLNLIGDIPIVSEIPFIENDSKIMSENDRSILAESFRILRTNINYLLPLRKNKLAPIIYVSSTIKGEGKTFTSINIGMAYATMGKKVLVIGADLRNPQLHNYTNLNKEHLGLSNFLYDFSINWKDLIIKNQFTNSNLELMFSGIIPPNPAELLSNGRLETLLGEAKEIFDYIIIDTAPTLLVTDTLTISQLADVSLFVVRAEYTDKNLLQYSIELKENGKLKNMAYVLNNVGANSKYGYRYGYKYGYRYGYAYGYGYGYGEDVVNKSSWLRNFLIKIKRS